LLDGDPNNPIPKITDFGIAITDKTEMTTFCGTMDYAAPEVLGRKDAAGLRYGMQVDMWSLGIILYMILCGNHPFADQDQSLTSSKKVTFSEPVWKSISDDARDLVLKLIEKNPTLRLNVQDALKHRWFDGLSVEDHVFVAPSSPLKRGPVPTVVESPPVLAKPSTTVKFSPTVVGVIPAPAAAATTTTTTTTVPDSAEEFEGGPLAALLFANTSTPRNQKSVLKVKETPMNSKVRRRGVVDDDDDDDDDDDSGDEDRPSSGNQSEGLSTPPGRAPRVLVPKSGSPSRHPLVPDESWKIKPMTVKPVEERMAGDTDDEGEDISDDEASQTRGTRTAFGGFGFDCNLNSPSISPLEVVPRSSKLFPALPPRSFSFRGKVPRTKRR